MASTSTSRKGLRGYPPACPTKSISKAKALSSQNASGDLFENDLAVDDAVEDAVGAIHVDV